MKERKSPQRLPNNPAFFHATYQGAIQGYNSVVPEETSDVEFGSFACQACDFLFGVLRST